MNAPNTNVIAKSNLANGEVSSLRESPASAGETLARDAENGGGPFKEPPEY